jgi:hypothetical protein
METAAPKTFRASMQRAAARRGGSMRAAGAVVLMASTTRMSAMPGAVARHGEPGSAGRASAGRGDRRHRARDRAGHGQRHTRPHPLPTRDPAHRAAGAMKAQPLAAACPTCGSLALGYHLAHATRPCALPGPCPAVPVQLGGGGHVLRARVVAGGRDALRAPRPRAQERRRQEGARRQARAGRRLRVLPRRSSSDRAAGSDRCRCDAAGGRDLCRAVHRRLGTAPDA